MSQSVIIRHRPALRGHAPMLTRVLPVNPQTDPIKYNEENYSTC